LFGDFLPVLEFWMIPLGILMLPVDFRWARRVYLRIAVVWRRWKRLLMGMLLLFLASRFVIVRDDIYLPVSQFQ